MTVIITAYVIYFLLGSIYSKVDTTKYIHIRAGIEKKKRRRKYKEIERAQKAKLAAGYLLLFDWSDSLETAAEEASRPNSLSFSFLSLQDKKKNRENGENCIYNSSNWSSARKKKERTRRSLRNTHNFILYSM